LISLNELLLMKLEKFWSALELAVLTGGIGAVAPERLRQKQLRLVEVIALR
jgi:hypothetical protein